MGAYQKNEFFLNDANTKKRKKKRNNVRYIIQFHLYLQISKTHTHTHTHTQYPFCKKRYKQNNTHSELKTGFLIIRQRLVMLINAGKENKT